MYSGLSIDSKRVCAPGRYSNFTRRTGTLCVVKDILGKLDEYPVSIYQIGKKIVGQFVVQPLNFFPLTSLLPWLVVTLQVVSSMLLFCS